MNKECSRVLDSVVTSLRVGGAPSAESTAHLTSCDDCRRVIAGLRALEAELAVEGGTGLSAGSVEAAVEETVEMTLSAARRRRWVRAILGVVIAVVIALVVWAMSKSEPGVPLPLIIATVITPLLVLGILFAALHALFRSRKRPLYKRLGPGRHLEGVCLGLAEATGTPVLIFRLAFLVLLFVPWTALFTPGSSASSPSGFMNGWVLGLYILCSFMMPVHPADRQNLLRFRIARAWRARFS
jgi:phage shock protein PspC (stress-responsive transcriptional regulator)